MEVRLDKLLKAAGEPTRLRILNLLRQESICVCDLQAVLRVSQPTISRHLAALRNAGLVVDSRNGTRVNYSLAPAQIAAIAALYELLERCCPMERAMQEDVVRYRELVRQGPCSEDAGGAR